MALPVPSEGEGEGEVPAVFFWVVIRNSSRPESNATLAPATIHGRGCRFPTAVSDRPQDWQKREPARMVASQRGQRWAASEAPQLAQNLPVASDPQAGHRMVKKITTRLLTPLWFPTYLSPMVREGGTPKPTRFDPPLSEIKARSLGELARGELRWDVVLETVLDRSVKAIRGRIHFVSGATHRFSTWIFLEWSEKEVEERFGEFSAQELWNLLDSLDQ
jgi:hypothetical protein